MKLLFKALGIKASENSKEADKVAWVRVIILLQAVITNLFIIANCIKHW